MKTKLEFKSEKVEISESGGEYFQVIFKNKEGPKQYFLIQRAFEFEEFDDSPSCYMESHISDCNGHAERVGWELTDKEFTCRYKLDEEVEIKIQFDEPEEKAQEIRSTLKTIFSRLDK